VIAAAEFAKRQFQRRRFGVVRLEVSAIVSVRQLLADAGVNLRAMVKNPANPAPNPAWSSFQWN
jgi:hypothetical protein